MADPNDIKKWRSYFLSLTTDQNVLDADRFKSLMSMLDDAKTVGYVDDSFVQKFQSYRQRRIEQVRKTPLRNPSTGQPAFKINPQGKTVPVTGADLFAGNKFMPEAGPAGVMQAREERMAGLKAETQREVERLGKVREAIAPSSAMGNVAMGAQALGEVVRSVPAWAQIGLSAIPGVGEFVRPPSPEEFAAKFVQGGDITEMTPEQARQEVMKPARAGGLAFGEGVAPTLGGIAGGSLGVAGLGAIGLAAGPAAPVAIPIAAALGSFGGALGGGWLQEKILERAYGSDVYQKQVKPLVQRAYEESGSAATAGALGNVLLQGAPVLSSGIGTRRMLGLARAAFKGEEATLLGTSSQLGVGAQSLSAANAAALPNIIARSPNKYERLVTPLLGKFGAAASQADDAYKVFKPTPGAGPVQRQGELMKFVQQTPGASDYLADAIGEQFFNVGQAAYDYVNQLQKGQNPSALEALTNLAFGSVFIGNNKFTDIAGGAFQAAGGAVLSGLEQVPGVGAGVTAIKKRYDEQRGAIVDDILRTQARGVIQSEAPTDVERQLGVRRRLVEGGRTTRMDLQPDEVAYPIGEGKATILNRTTGDTRILPYADVFGGVDDTATVDLGQRMGEAIAGLATERTGSGLNRLGMFGGADIVRQVGPNRQQIIGISKVEGKDEGHVIVREQIPVEGDAKGRSDSYVKVDFLRLDDVEAGNRDEAEKMLSAAGLKPSVEVYESLPIAQMFGVDTAEVSPMSALQVNQELLANILPDDVVNQFPTEVRVEDGVVLRGRILGVEKNGDVRVQLLSEGMDIVRVSPATLEGPKGSTVTREQAPISLSDLMDEQDISSAMIPKQGSTYNVFDKPSVPLHTVSFADRKDAVLLTPEQRQKLPILVDQVTEAEADARKRNLDTKALKQARNRAIAKAARELFGDDGPKTNREYEIGSAIKVDGPNGPEWGVVIENTDAGAMVALPSLDGAPILAQDQSILEGDFTEREMPEEPEQPQAAPSAEKKAQPKVDLATTIDQYMDVPVAESVLDDAKKMKQPKARARFVIAQILRMQRDGAQGIPVGEPLAEIFGFKNVNGVYVGTLAQLSDRLDMLKGYLNYAANFDESSKGFANQASQILDAIYQDITQRIKDKKVILSSKAPRAKTPAKTKDTIAQGQVDAIVESEQAKPERKMTELQVRAIRGIDRVVNTPEGLIRVVFATKGQDGRIRLRNLAQSAIIKTYEGKPLTKQEEQIVRALDMPDASKKEWWRSAYQGVKYLNDANIQRALDKIGKVMLDSDAKFTLDDEFKGAVLTPAEKTALQNGAFVNDDGTLDRSGIRIYGGSERGFRTGFGQLAQVTGDIGPETGDLAVEMLEAYVTGDPDERLTFEVLRATDKASFRVNLLGLAKKTAVKKGKTVQQVEAEVDAIVELFDTFVHGATGRRIEMMLDAAKVGAFTTRAAGAQQIITVPATREQKKGFEIDSYLEADLKPLYARLRQLLGLQPKASLQQFMERPANREKIALAVAQLNEEETQRFYAERMPAVANFKALPEVNNILGQVMDIYDPVNQVSTQVIMAFKSANISTFVHEVAHAFFEALPYELKEELSSSLGHTLRVPTLTNASVLTYEAQEKFAYGLEVSLANINGLRRWVGQNLGKKAETSKRLLRVLSNAGDAVAQVYEALIRNNVATFQRPTVEMSDLEVASLAIPGAAKAKAYQRNWAIPYQANGRIFLWNGAPIILKDGRYATVTEKFGTTKNPSRLVETSVGEIRNGEIAAIGGPTQGLNPTTMQILSIWIGSRQNTPGLVNSTPQGRASSLVRDNSGNVVRVDLRQDLIAPGEVTNANIDSIVGALGLNPTSEMIHAVIRDAFGEEELKYILKNLPKISKEFARDVLGMSQEDAVIVQLTHAYADAKIRARLESLRKQQESLPAADRKVWYKRVVAALDGGTSRDNPAKMAIYWNAVNAAERIILANRYTLSQVRDVLLDIASGKGKSNWAIATTPDGKPRYNAQQGTIVIVQTFKARGRKAPVSYEYSVNLNTGQTVSLTPGAAVPGAIPDFNVPDTLEANPWSAKVKKGGIIPIINAEVKEALDKAGIVTDQFKAFTPEYFIAEALMKAGVSSGQFANVQRPASFLAQVGLVSENIDDFSGVDGGAALAQIGLPDVERMVVPEIPFADLITKPDRMDVIRQATAEGQVDQAMQVTGATVTQMNEQAKAAQRAWVERNLLALEEKAGKALAKARADWQKDNPGKTPQLYQYEAYLTTEIFDVENGQPWFKEDGMPDEKGDMPVRQERVRTIVFSYEDLTKRGQSKTLKYWETDRWTGAEAGNAHVKEFSAIDITGGLTVDVRSKKKVDETKGGVAKRFAAGAQSRVREIGARWPSQYNPSIDAGEPVDPTMAWLPSHLDVEASVKTKKIDETTSISVLMPRVTPQKRPYALDKVEGNEGWGGLNFSTLPVANRANPTVVAKALVAHEKVMISEYQKASFGKRQHQVVVFPMSFGPDGKPDRWGYRIMIRDDSFKFVFATDNNNGKGYATANDAREEAKIEHGRLFGIARAKQEESVARRVAEETSEIVEIARRGLAKSAANRTKEEENAINILLQFTWYKSMEKRLVGTYGPFATAMADFLGATSPQTPVWQNYLATMFLMQAGVGKHRRRIAISKATIDRNPAIAEMVKVVKKGVEEIDPIGATMVIQSDAKRTLLVKRLHDGLLSVYKNQSSSPDPLTVDNYRTKMADIEGWQGKSWVELFEADVPAAKRAEVLKQFTEYLTAGPSRLGGTTKKDIQFRSFVMEVDDWVEPKGEVVRVKKGRPVETLGVVGKGTRIALAESIIPRNLLSGNLFGSNSQNVILALANEWLNVAPGMSSKARNFALNFIGLSKGATIDVWAARLTRRHMNEHFMGLKQTQVPRMEDGNAVLTPQGEPITDPETLIVDEEKYAAWLALPEEERKQYFRLMPMQEGAVQGGYVANVANAVNLNGYFTEGAERVQPELVGEEREYTDVRDARISGEFGAANRIFAMATEKINQYLGQPGFMSAADLQAVVWFAEKARWTQNGWTTAAGAGGSFEQMYNEIAYRSGGYLRGTVSIGMRDGSKMFLSEEEKSYLLDLVAAPFMRQRKEYYTPGSGDIQQIVSTEEQVDLLPAPPVSALMVNVLSRKEFNESVEASAQGQVSLSAMLSRGRGEKADKYEGTVPLVSVSTNVVRRIALQLQGGRTVYVPVRDAASAVSEMYANGIGQRTVFAVQGDGVPKIFGSAVIEDAAVVELSEVPETERVGPEGSQYVRFSLRTSQPNVDSDVYLHGQGGLDKTTGEFGTPVKRGRGKVDPYDAFFGTVANGVEKDISHIGQLPVEIVKGANKKASDSVLPFPPRVAASTPGNMGMFVESALNVLAGVRDSKDAFVSFIQTVQGEDDPLYDPESEINTVPSARAYKTVAASMPERNLRYGVAMIMENPVGQQRQLPAEEQRIMVKINRILTMMKETLPDVGYTFRIDADARDIFSDITGNKGFPIVEVIFSPEQFIRDFVPVAEVDGQVPTTEAKRQKLFEAYVAGDVKAMREAEASLAEAVQAFVKKVSEDPSLAGGIVLANESVYTGHAIPKELVKEDGRTIEQIAKDEFARRSAPDYTIGQAATEYAAAIGKTAYAETVDSYYDGQSTPRVAPPSDIVHDWGGISDYSVMAQMGFSPFRQRVVGSTNNPRVRRVNLVASALAGDTRAGYDFIYQSAMQDYAEGRLAEFQKKMNFIGEMAKEEFDNAFSGLDIEWHASLNPSVIAGDAKPSIVGTAKVTESDFNRVIGRAARIGKRLAQPNVFITTDAGSATYGVKPDGSVVVPSIRLKLTRALDPADLRLLVDMNPSVFNGANQSVDQKELELFMVPDGNFGRAEAKAWTDEAIQFINRFFDEDVAGLKAPGTMFTAVRGLEKQAPGIYKKAGRAFQDVDAKRQFKKATPKAFFDALEAVKDVEMNGKPIRLTLSPYTAEDYSKMSVFLSEDKKSGYAIKLREDGQRELINVFSAVKGRGTDLVYEAVAYGKASVLDAYDENGFLPQLYAKFGFEVIEVWNWDPQYKPEGWDVEKYGTPNVVLMRLKPEVERDVEAIAGTEVGQGRAYPGAVQGRVTGAGQGLPVGIPSGVGDGIADAGGAGPVEGAQVEDGNLKAIAANGAVSQAGTGRLRLWNIGSEELGGKGKFLDYDHISAIISAVAPDDTVPSPETVTFVTNERLRREVEFALSLVYGQPVELPKRVEFKRTRMHSALQKSIADHFDLMPLSALETDPFVKKAYESLVRELDAQWKAMNLTIEFMPVKTDASGKVVKDADGYDIYLDPYGAVSETVIRDMQENRHMYIYPTTPSSFGSSSVSWTNHPLLEMSPHKTADGKPMLWNDVLRAVHDAIAHGIYGSSFGKNGEEMAFATHAMVTKDPWAIWALSMETRMQNSWVHFNKNNLDEFGRPRPWNEESTFSDQKVGLPVFEALYTGLNQVDDRLRAFSVELREKHGGYNGTVEYLRKNNPDALAPEARGEAGKISLEGMANGMTAFGDQAVLVHNPKLKNKAIVDLKNGVVEGNLTQEDLEKLQGEVSTAFSSAELTPEQIRAEFLKGGVDGTSLAQIQGPGQPAAMAVQPQGLSPVQRATLILNRILKLGAAGDASPLLMQNFLLANPLENPAMMLRQIKLQAQILANPNIGFQRRDGTIINADGMRGRKFFDETLEMEVRRRRNYSAAVAAGLDLTANFREQALKEWQTNGLGGKPANPNATYAMLDELGYDTDVAAESEFLKHLPGQGPSERFFSLSKDLVKMAAFDNAVQHLLDLGYTPTPFFDANGNPIKSNWTNALKDIAALMNVMSSDVKFASSDEIDRKMATVAKIFFFAPRWMTSRLLLNQWGRHAFEWGASRFGKEGADWADKVLTINRMNKKQLANRDVNVTKMHQRFMGKAYLQWLAFILGLYMMRLTNPNTMEVSVEGALTKVRIGEFSFRAPGAILTNVEMTLGLLDAVRTLDEGKPGADFGDQVGAVWEQVGKVLMSRASPLLSAGAEVLSGRNAFGEPAFIPDEAVDRYWQEVVSPALRDAGIQGPKDLKINKAITRRMLWWWLRDGIETYNIERRFGMNKSESLLRGALVGAYSSQGGRVSFAPKALRWEREANERMEAYPDLVQEWLSGETAKPIDTSYPEPDVEGEEPGPVPSPLIGDVGDYRTPDTKFD